MMNIIIPMAGAGQRFADEGYQIHKPVIPTVDRRSGKEYPMVICAAMDLPGVLEDGENITFIDRLFHKEAGVEDTISAYYKKAHFITVEKLTEGQACTCLLAKEIIDNDQELLIAGCDNGMVMDEAAFQGMKQDTDCLVFTYRNHEAVLKNPDAYGWVCVSHGDNITGVSVKKAISDNPVKDHAIVATFWFKKGSIFVEAAERMMDSNDRINGEFYVDQVIKHVLELGYSAKVFEIDRYIGWGTPKDYENYTRTIRYWETFVNDKRFLPGE